jgi:hypothetical protein
MFATFTLSCNIGCLYSRYKPAGCQWLTPIIPATWETEVRIAIQRQLGQIVLETLHQKYPTQKRAGRVSQVVGCLPSKLEALNSNPSPAKNPQKYIN